MEENLPPKTCWFQRIKTKDGKEIGRRQIAENELPKTLVIIEDERDKDEWLKMKMNCQKHIINETELLNYQIIKMRYHWRQIMPKNKVESKQIFLSSRSCKCNIETNITKSHQIWLNRMWAKLKKNKLELNQKQNQIWYSKQIHKQILLFCFVMQMQL